MRIALSSLFSLSLSLPAVLSCHARSFLFPLLFYSLLCLLATHPIPTHPLIIVKLPPIQTTLRSIIPLKCFAITVNPSLWWRAGGWLVERKNERMGCDGRDTMERVELNWGRAGRMQLGIRLEGFFNLPLVSFAPPSPFAQTLVLFSLLHSSPLNLVQIAKNWFASETTKGIGKRSLKGAWKEAKSHQVDFERSAVLLQLQYLIFIGKFHSLALFSPFATNLLSCSGAVSSSWDG